MNRGVSRLLPFGDKNAMLVIVFLVLSLGIVSLQSDKETTPVSALHPSLVTIRQTTQGYLGIEKLVFLSVDDFYFVDQPISRPHGLDEHSITDKVNYPEGGQVFGDRVSFALDNTLSAGSIFHAAGARRDNTGVANGIVIDDDYLLTECIEIMKTKAPVISIDGQCKQLKDVIKNNRFWSNIYAVAEYFPEDPGRCVGDECSVLDNGADISFSGIDQVPWNGAAMSFKKRAAFKRNRQVIGLICGLEATVQEHFLNEVRHFFADHDYLIWYGNSSFRLFDKATGYPYLEKRLIGNAEMSIVVSAFDPNNKKSVTQTKFNFRGLQLGEGLPDGVMFSNMQACEDTNTFLTNKSNNNFEDKSKAYPSQIVRLFKFDLKSGQIFNVFGVDEIEKR